jgi:dihydroorotase
VDRFPNLRVVLEHVTTAGAVDFVANAGDRVAATITAHHLELTVDDWAGRNHNFCKPVAKYPRDRAALRRVVREGHPRFFLGSDSAPHPRSAKEAAAACAGVFTSPLLLPYLADAFERIDCLDRLTDFVSRFGRRFYGLSPAESEITLERRRRAVPATYGDVVPFRAGETLEWSIRS